MLDSDGTGDAGGAASGSTYIAAAVGPASGADSTSIPLASTAAAAAVRQRNATS